MNKTNIIRRVAAALLALLMVVGMLPATALQAGAKTGSVLSTNIEGQTFLVGQATEFTYTTTANDDAGKLVKGRFTIKRADTQEEVSISQVAKLEYRETQDGAWHEFYGDFGPEGGFQLSDATSTFRVTFRQAGQYTVCVEMKAVEEEKVLCSTTSQITVRPGEACAITTNLGEKTFCINSTVNFDVTVQPNDDAGKQAIGIFELQNNRGTAIGDPQKVVKLEYQDSQDGTWHEFYGDFGPEGGFPLTTATRHFRATFKKMGSYQAVIKLVDPNARETAYATVTCKLTRILSEDKAAPTVEVNSISEGYQKEIIIKVSATDRGSAGVKTVVWNRENRFPENDGSRELKKVSGTYDLKVTENGSYFFWAVDRAGNRSESVEVVITTVDKEAPVMRVTADPKTWANSVTVSVDVEDMDPNVTVQYSTTGVGGKDAQKIKLTGGDEISATGRHKRTGSFTISGVERVTQYCYVWAEDGAGHSTSATIDLKYDGEKPVVTASKDTEDWTDAVTISGTVSDQQGSGVKAVYYLEKKTETEGHRVELGDQGAYSFQVRDNGTYCIWAEDQVGNQAVPTEVQVKNIDKKEPVIGLTQMANKWVNGAVTVSGTVSDVGAGVASIWYAPVNEIGKARQLGSGDQLEMDGSTFRFVIPKPAENLDTDFYVWAKDKAGNVSMEAACGHVRMDVTAPELRDIQTNLAAGAVSNEAVTVTGTAAEKAEGTESGVKRVLYGKTTDVRQAKEAQYDSDGKTFQFKVSESFKGTYYIWAEDVAGNRSEAYSVEICVDMTAPVITASAPEGWTNGPVTIEGTVNDEADESGYASGIGDQGVVWATENNFETATAQGVTLKDGEFTLQVEGPFVGSYFFWAVDNAGNRSDSAVEVLVQIDVKEPDVTIRVDNDPWSMLLETLTFGLWSNKGYQVTISAEDESSGVEEIVYFKTSEGTALTVEELEAKAEWEPIENKGEVTVDRNEAFVIYARATDKAGNLSYVCTDGYVADNVESAIELIPAPANENGLYGGDSKAEVEIKVRDAEPYSGIHTVTYWVENKGVKTQEATLYSFNYVQGEDLTITDWDSEKQENTAPVTTKGAPSKGDLRGVWDGVVVIDKEKNNGDDVAIYVEVTDNAGNVKREMKKLEIDTVAPAIEVSFDNNQSYRTHSDGTKDSFYFADNDGNVATPVRTATVTIRERHFNPDKATAGISIKAVDARGAAVKNAYEISPWGRDDGENPEGIAWTATVTFRKDANYTWSIAYADEAGNGNDPVTTGDSVAPFAFTIDTVGPTGALTATATEKDGRSETWSGLDGNFSFGFWAKDQIAVTATANDATSGPIAEVAYFKAKAASPSSDWEIFYDETRLARSQRWQTLATDQKAGALMEVTRVTGDERFVVYMKLTDLAGNVSYLRTNGLIVDHNNPRETVAPKVTVTPQQPVNGIYKGNVQVDIQVEEPIVGSAYSGLKTVSYKVFNQGVETKSEVLYRFNATATKQEELQRTFARTIEIDSAKNNSNDVRVVVYAEDNALNSAEAIAELKIDTTAPSVFVSYNNNSADGGSYFKDTRVATVTVSERNFDPSAVELTVTNAEGPAPAVSGWTQHAGTGNGDNTTWTATITYSADGVYSFDMACTDLAGNRSGQVSYAGGTVAGSKFTVDKTAPKVSVTYDRNDPRNGNYYDAPRTATVTVVERNFDPNRVNITLTATNDGSPMALPQVSGWSGSGSTHTATVSFREDGYYTFDIAVTDKAGNASGNYGREAFHVDTTAPKVTIEGVKDGSANRGDVIPVITVSDTNFDAASVKITLEGANNGAVTPEGSFSSIRNGQVFTFKNFKEEKDVDDIYTLSVAVTDKAGLRSELTYVFSVNRFGSTYVLSEETKALNETYVQEPIDVVISEINADQLSDIKLTLFKNNETRTLEEGQDYSITTEGGKGGWYKYTYTVFAKNFADDGVYRMNVHSKDAAGNVSENTLDTKNTALSFGVDKTAPNLVVSNLASHTTYALDGMTVSMFASDNLVLGSLQVYLDDDSKPYMDWSGEEIAEILAGDGAFTFHIPGDSTGTHRVLVVCTDTAGNEYREEFTDFYVTTNMWVRFYTNTPLLVGTIIGAVLLVAAIVILVAAAKRRKSKKK